MEERIPVDDISLEYAKARESVQVGITALLRNPHICGMSDEEGVMVLWEASPELSLQIIASFINLGEREFGRIWLEELASRVLPKA